MVDKHTAMGEPLVIMSRKKLNTYRRGACISKREREGEREREREGALYLKERLRREEGEKASH